MPIGDKRFSDLPTTAPTKNDIVPFLQSIAGVLTPIKAAWSTIFSMMGYNSGEATITLTGNQNAIALSGASVLRCNNASLLTIRGIAAGVAGQALVIVSVGAGQVNLSHQDTGEGTAVNRLINDVTIGPTCLAPGCGVARYVYDGTTQRWRLTAHEQGDWIAATFNANDYTGNGAMTVTVNAGMVDRNTFYVRGRTYLWGIQVSAFTIGGVGNTQVQVVAPGGYQLADDAQNTFVVQASGGPGGEIGRVFPISVNPIQFAVNRNNIANWVVGAAGSYFSGSIFIPIN